MYNLLLTASGTSSWVLPIVLVVLLVAMIVLPMVSQNKRVKQYNEMQTNLKVGDKIQTIGGIVGRIIKFQEKEGAKTVYIETGDKKSKIVLEFDINAIAGPIIKVNTATNQQSDGGIQEPVFEEPTIDEPKDELLEQIEKSAKEKSSTKKSKK